MDNTQGNIIATVGEYTVRVARFGRTDGYAVYRERGTHAVKVARQ